VTELLYSDSNDNVKFYHIRIFAARTTGIDEIFLSDKPSQPGTEAEGFEQLPCLRHQGMTTL